MRDRDDLHRQKIEQLRNEIAIGIKELDQGKSVPFNKATVARVKANGRKRLIKKQQNGCTTTLVYRRAFT